MPYNRHGLQCDETNSSAVNQLLRLKKNSENLSIFWRSYGKEQIRISYDGVRIDWKLELWKMTDEMSGVELYNEMIFVRG